MLTMFFFLLKHNFAQQQETNKMLLKEIQSLKNFQKLVEDLLTTLYLRTLNFDFASYLGTCDDDFRILVKII